MTTNDLIQKFGKYAIGAFIGFLLFWVFQQLFFSKDKDDPSGRNYKKENVVLQSEIDSLRSSFIRERQELKSRVKESEEEELELRIKLRQIDKHYEKIDFKSHTFDELDSMRDRALSDLREE